MCYYVSMLLCGEVFTLKNVNFGGTNDITLRNIVVSLTSTAEQIANINSSIKNLKEI
jgi:hypothetical protein